MQATMKWFDDAKGYGFAKLEGGRPDVFVHFSAIDATGFRTLNEGDLIEFDLVEGPKGLSATSVRVVREAAE